MADQPLLLALDQGTSSSRAAVFDAQGELVASASAPLPIQYPADGWVEQHPDAIWSSQRQALIDLHDGLSDDQRAGVVELLKAALADQHVLFMRMRNYHWNVTGPQFQQLHELIEAQYDQIADAIDETAERIRQYGEFAPGTLQEMLDLTRMSEEPGVVPSAREMVAKPSGAGSAVTSTVYSVSKVYTRPG